MRYIEQWCDTAVSYIRFPPDRPAVRQELLEHMQDKYDDYMGQGMLPADAERRVIREMGSDRETGLLLRQIHKPYLGWVWRATQWLLILALILACLNFVWWKRDLYFIDESASIFRQDLLESSADDSGKRVLNPGCADSSDGYTFTVTKVACWDDRDAFYFRMEVTNPRPWAGYTEAPRWFHAVDSLGNYYYAYYEADRSTEGAVAGNGGRTGLFSYTWDMWIDNYVSQDADWLELRYDKEGRDIALRIDLTGGEGA